MTCPQALSVSSRPHPCPSTLSATLALAAAQTFRQFFGRNWSKPPITEHFSDACHPPLPPSLSFFTTLIITWHRIFPTLYCVFPSILCVNYFPVFCLQLFPCQKNYALRIKKIHFDKYFSSKWLSCFGLMPSVSSWKRMDRVKILLVSMIIRPIYISMSATVSISL